MGIKDTCYASLFAKEDIPLLRKLARKIQLTHDQRLVDDFNQKCESKYNDHNPLLQIGSEYATFEQVTKADDLILTAGINKCIDLILAPAGGTDPWRYVFVGTGITQPAITDTTLSAQLPYSVDIPFTGGGWREFANSSLRIAAIFGESVATATITEAGVRNAGGTFLNRCMFSNYPLSHTINVTGFVISFVIEFVPVM